MSSVSNLRQFRKEAARAEKRARGAEGTVASGVSKHQRQLATKLKQKADAALDAHQVTPKEPE